MYHKDPFKSTFEFTRPNDSVSYTQGDVINSVISGGRAYELTRIGAGLGLNSSEIISIKNFSVTCSSSPAASGTQNAIYNIIIFSEDPEDTDFNDNLALSTTFDQSKSITILTGQPISTGTIVTQPFTNGFKTFDSIILDKYIEVLPNQTSLWAVLTVWNDYTFDSQSQFFVEIEGYRIGGIN